MNDFMMLLHHMTTTTLAAMAADLDGITSMAQHLGAIMDELVALVGQAEARALVANA